MHHVQVYKSQKVILQKWSMKPRPLSSKINLLFPRFPKSDFITTRARRLVIHVSCSVGLCQQPFAPKRRCADKILFKKCRKIIAHRVFYRFGVSQRERQAALISYVEFSALNGTSGRGCHRVAVVRQPCSHWNEAHVSLLIGKPAHALLQ